jgi:hypothetical protein
VGIVKTMDGKTPHKVYKTYLSLFKKKYGLKTKIDTN